MIRAGAISESWRGKIAPHWAGLGSCVMASFAAQQAFETAVTLASHLVRLRARPVMIAGVVQGSTNVAAYLVLGQC